MSDSGRMPLIEKYAFGSMRVGGRTYYSDIIVTAEAISEWWREESHLVQPADVASIMENAPSVLVIGTGYSGGMRVSNEVVKLCEEKGVELVSEVTMIALDVYNKILLKGEKTAAAAFHLTC